MKLKIEDDNIEIMGNHTFFTMKNNTALLSTAYFPPIEYYSKLISYDKIFIEKHENYPKQTYRNRCEILGANGILTLSIPVTKLKPKTFTKDILIDYSTKWQKNHKCFHSPVVITG